MDIAIFGAGIAGLTTAIALGKGGHRCRIFERLRESHDAGMGFIVTPEAMERLEDLGVPLTGQGVLLDRYVGRDSSGRIMHEEALPMGARGIRRRDLIAALVRALPEDTSFIFNAELESLEFDESGAVTHAELDSAYGSSRVQAALYVGADGVRSRTRQALFADWQAPQSRVQEVTGLIDSRGVLEWAGRTFNKFHAASGGAAFGVLPVDRDHVVWYLQFDTQRFPQPEEHPYGLYAFVKNVAGAWAHPIPHLLTQTDFARVHLWRPVDSNLIPRFHQQNLVLVGDAAHPLLPFTSQGVSSAIADAVSLAHWLSGDRDPFLGLAAYSAERRKQCLPYVARGRELTEHFLSPLVDDRLVLPIA